MSAPGWKASYPKQEESRWSGPKPVLIDEAETRKAESTNGIYQAVKAATNPAARPAQYMSRMSVRVGDNIVLIPVRDVVWVESDRNLLRLYLPNASYKHRMTLKEISKRLDPERFFRINRSAIVNLDHVVEFVLPRCGNSFAHLSNGQALRVSRAGRLALRRRLFSQSVASADFDPI
jgi:two-component system, LytTR family, response regulator